MNYQIVKKLLILDNLTNGCNTFTKAYKKYDPDNGWGGTQSALECLKSIYEYFYPEKAWNREWDEDIPLECMYMKF